jgi:LysR family hydrogen peroxide-inducible transcriptional activator
MAVPAEPVADDLLVYVPFTPPAPTREIVLAWRKSFPRQAAIDALREAMLGLDIAGVKKLTSARQNSS